ncbi:fusion protein [Tuhoko virus 1]|uniref:Fusion glycoprotein F0 n=1 Tax=Tuhoko virus 1 TaxID=798072 RepID=D8WJ26_9MONO|nr:fusion protein [Tuhoko virus 1]ADI80713.1 fusion protein [Tuhoko virus 1]
MVTIIKPLILLVTVILQISGHIDTTALTSIGAVIASSKEIMYYAQSTPNYIVIKLIPNLPNIPSQCNFSSIAYYNKTLLDLFTPISDNINMLHQRLSNTGRNRRFAGVAIGLAALGVATAAQVTAAFALVEAKSNTAKIAQIGQAIQNTNAAINSLNAGIGGAVTAIQAIQTQINGIITDQINAATCTALDAQIGTLLNMYLLQLTTTFQPQIQNPALQPLSIQALHRIMQGTSIVLSNLTDSSKYGLNDALSAGLITGQIVSVDLRLMQITIAANVPTLSRLENAIAHDIMRITTNVNNTEVIVQLPETIMEHAGRLYQFNKDHCLSSTQRFFCPYSDAKLLTSKISSCLSGIRGDCIFSPVVGNFATRFISVKGVIIANCKFIRCTCLQPEGIISQLDDHTLTVIDLKLCNKLDLGLIQFDLQVLSNISYEMTLNTSQNQLILTDPLDLSSELQTMNQSINNAANFIEKSNSLLNSSTYEFNRSVALLVALILLSLTILYVIVLTCVVKLLVHEVSKNRRHIQDLESHHK